MSGTIALVGPSTNPGAPQITPAALNAAVNAAIVINNATAASLVTAERVRAQGVEATATAALPNITANTNAIAAETTARSAADAAEIVARNGAIQVETTRALAAEAVAATTGGAPPSGALPVVNSGIGVVGTELAYSHGNHAHPTDLSRYAATNPAGFQTAADQAAALSAGITAAFNNPSFTGTLLSSTSMSSLFGGFGIAPAYTFTNGEVFGLSFRNSQVTGTDIASSVFGGGPPTFFDGVQGVSVLNAGSTITQTNGIAGYVRVNSTSTGGGGASVGVAVAGFIETTVDNSGGWGSAIVVSDTGTGTGAGRTLVGGEYDFNIRKPNTKVTGIVLTGGSSVQPTTDTMGYVLGGLGPGYNWNKGFVSLDVCANIGLSLGLAPPPGSIISKNSQFLVLRASEAAGNIRETWLYSNESGLHITGDGSGGGRTLFVDNGGLSSTGIIELAKQTATPTASVPLFFYSNDAGGVQRTVSMQSLNGKTLAIIGNAGVAMTLIDPVAPTAFTSVGTDLIVQNSNVTAASLYTYLYGRDGISSTISIPPGSTVIQTNSVSGVVQNRNPTGTVGVGVNFFGTAEVDGARTWGTAGVLQDYPSFGTDVGGTGRLLQNEWDFRVKHASTQVVGLVLTLDVQAGGAQPTNADCFIAGATPGGKWINGFRSYDNEAVRFATVGMVGGTGGTPNLNSQPFVFTGTDGTGTYLETQFVYVGSTKTLQLVSSATIANFSVTHLITAGGFATVDNAPGVVLGTAATGNNSGSQSLSLTSRDSGGVVRSSTLTADPLGGLSIVAPGGIVGIVGADLSVRTAAAATASNLVATTAFVARAATGRNVVAYGAIGDGVTDCSAAFNAAFAASDGVVDVPAGNWVLTQPLVWTGKAITLRCVGKGVATIYQRHAGVGLTINQSSLFHTVNISGLTWRASHTAPCAAALDLSWPDATSFFGATVTIENCEFDGTTAASSAGYPNTFIDNVRLTGAWLIRLSGVTGFGVPTIGTGLPLAGTSLLRLNKCFGITLNGSKGCFFDALVRQSGYCEGLAFDSCDSMGCNTTLIQDPGLLLRSGFALIGLWATNCEFNNYLSGFDTRLIRAGQVVANHFSRWGDSGATGYVCVKYTDCDTLTHSANVLGGGGGDSPVFSTAKAIVLAGNTSGVSFDSSNLIVNCSVGASLGAGTSWNMLIDVRALNVSPAATFTDLGTNNELYWSPRPGSGPLAVDDLNINGTGNIAGAWATYTPSVSAGAGTITASTSAGRYRKIGRTVFVSGRVSITNNGTGSSDVRVSLPAACVAGDNSFIPGREEGTTGRGVSGAVFAGTNLMALTYDSDNTYPGSNTAVLIFSGTYEAAA